nr:dixin isoform X2 [Anolis sagrei ordinatus]
MSTRSRRRIVGMSPKEDLCSIRRTRADGQQLQAYVAWVNSQLKKKPAVKPVQDLRQDLRDGVVLASLVEIVAGEKLSGIQVSPTNQQEMKENVEKVLQFVASKKIRMHQTSAKDIVDGNLKCIMRLILALAAHFKPGSSKATNQAASSAIGRSSMGPEAPSSNHRPHSTAAVAQGAMAALADVRQDVLRLGRDAFRRRRRNSSLDEEIEHPYWSVRALVQQYEGQQSVPSESLSSSLTSPSPINSTKSESSATPSEEKVGYDAVREEDDDADTRTDETGSFFPAEWQARCPAASLETSWEEQLLEQQDHLEKEMEEAKKMISGLQALLLNGSLPEDEQERLFALSEQEGCPEEQLVITRSRLDQSVKENQELKKELQKQKQETRSLQGVKEALQQRLAQQEALILQIKQELLRANMDKEELHSQNVELQRKVEDRNRLLAEYKCVPPPSPADDPNSHCVAEGAGPEGPPPAPAPGQDGGDAAPAVRGQLSAGGAGARAGAQGSPAGSVREERCRGGNRLQQPQFSEQWLPPDIRKSSSFHGSQRHKRPPAGPRGPAQFAEQLQWPRSPAPHHRQPGAGHLQLDGEAAPHGDAEEAGEEGPREVPSPACHQRIPGRLALQLQAASFAQHPGHEQQCLHQSALLHRPLPHSFHGQHTKEVG